MEGRLYKRAFKRHLLQCLGKGEAKYVIQKVHEGCCDSHVGGRTLTKKVLIARYY